MSEEHKILIIGANGQIGNALAADLHGDFSDRLVFADMHVGSRPNGNWTVLDIRDEKAVANLFSTAETYCAVVNLAYPRNEEFGNPVNLVSFESFCENVSWNLGGYFNVLKHATAHMCQRNIEGTIISYSSIYGVIAPDFSIYNETKMTMPVEYAAFKSGIIHLTKYFAKLNLRDGIRVNCISPGGIFAGQDKNFIEAYERKTGRIGLMGPNHTNAIVRTLISDDAKSITGQNFVIDDGFTL